MGVENGGLVSEGKRAMEAGVGLRGLRGQTCGGIVRTASHGPFSKRAM